MTIKYFDNGSIIIEYNKERVYIKDKYNDFKFTLDVKMKNYFIPYIERLYKICDILGKTHIPTHQYTNRPESHEILCNGIARCYRKYGELAGNYMSMNRKDKIISAFKECFKRVKEEDVELSDIDFKMFDIKSLLLIKKGLL